MYCKNRFFYCKLLWVLAIFYVMCDNSLPYAQIFPKGGPLQEWIPPLAISYERYPPLAISYERDPSLTIFYDRGIYPDNCT